MSSQPATALLYLAIAPHTHVDRGKLEAGLATLTADDPTLHSSHDEDSRQVLVWGTSEPQIESVVDRLTREFGVEATVGPLLVACKETLTRPAAGEMKYARQTGGRGHYGHAKICVFPGRPGSGYVFENKITPGAIPDEFITPIDDGIREALTRGVLAGYPIDDVRIELCDGSYHAVDSSEIAFRIAGAIAFQEAAKQGAPVLLEPIMRVEVTVPHEHVSAVLADLSTRRGHIESREVRGGSHILTARAPLAELLGYATELTAQTGGRATYAMRFDGYAPRPPDDAEGSASMARIPQGPKPPLRSASIGLPLSTQEVDNDRP